ncbi:MAG: adenylate/guanylate cyclase domain-containing protein [Proteobacteria bacterium TMED61]|nr:MAG: adenylate/guanylate cyclase domain-containing protein [Proteobacteria bacterium TMED61]
MSDLEQEINDLKKENKKLSLESKLRKSMAVELDRQKELLRQATEEVEAQKEKIEGISLKLSRYLPVQLYEQIFSGSLDIHKKSERKKLTIFFSDIVDFTSISEQIEAEEISEFLSFYLTEMSAIAEKFGGTIDKFIGDAIMIFFGDPKTEGDVQDAKNCVDVAIEMQMRIIALQSFIRKEFSFPVDLKIRIGVNTGFCNVGNFGSASRLDYTAIGRAINVASRLEAEAESGEVLVSENTKILLEDFFGFSTERVIHPKGVPHPVNCYSVAHEKSLNRESILGECFKLVINDANLTENDLNRLRAFVAKYTEQSEEKDSVAGSA